MNFIIIYSRNRTMKVRANSKQTKTADKNKPVNDGEKGKGYRKNT